MAAYQYVYHMSGVSKTYPGGKKCFDNINLNFLPGVKIGVVGVNGAGKSTLMKIMAGKDKDYSGEAWVAEGAKVGYLERIERCRARCHAVRTNQDGFGANLSWPIPSTGAIAGADIEWDTNDPNIDILRSLGDRQPEHTGVSGESGHIIARKRLIKIRHRLSHFL